MNGLTSSEFYEELQIFAGDSSSPYYDDIVFDDDAHENQSIKATRFTLKVKKSVDASGKYPEYENWNKIMSEHLGSSEDGFAFFPDYCYAYFQHVVLELTIENMLFTGLGVLIVLLLMLDVRMALFIIIVVFMIDANLFAWMWALDISLEVVSYVILVMNVGLSVDYVIHITHSIVESPGVDYNEKLKVAMSKMGVSVCKGAFTTLLGALLLSVSQSQAFRQFFYMFSGIIIIAVAHGMIFTPALLGELPFIYKGIHLPAHAGIKQSEPGIEMGKEKKNMNTI